MRNLDSLARRSGGARRIVRRGRRAIDGNAIKAAAEQIGVGESVHCRPFRHWQSVGLWPRMRAAPRSTTTPGRCYRYGYRYGHRYGHGGGFRGGATVRSETFRGGAGGHGQSARPAGGQMRAGAKWVAAP
jgi:hypothetical protein